jgi:hypothetical protein
MGLWLILSCCIIIGFWFNPAFAKEHPGKWKHLQTRTRGKQIFSSPPLTRITTYDSWSWRCSGRSESTNPCTQMNWAFYSSRSIFVANIVVWITLSTRYFSHNNNWIKIERYSKVLISPNIYSTWSDDVLVTCLNTVTKYLTETTQRRKDSFWLTVPEGSIHNWLAPCTWAEHHGSRHVWWRKFMTSGRWIAESPIDRDQGQYFPKICPE